MEDAVPRTGMILDLKSGRMEEVYALVVAMTRGVVISPRGVFTVHWPPDLVSFVAGVYVWRLRP